MIRKSHALDIQIKMICILVSFKLNYISYKQYLNILI